MLSQSSTGPKLKLSSVSDSTVLKKYYSLVSIRVKSLLASSKFDAAREYIDAVDNLVTRRAPQLSPALISLRQEVERTDPNSALNRANFNRSPLFENLRS